MSPVNCPTCGKENLDKAKFCTSCGENLSSLSDKRPSTGTSAFVMGDLASEPEPDNTQRALKKDTCIGQVLEGKYLILEHLGDGGMGSVYKAEQLSLNKSVAIKILHKNLLQDDVQVKRFQREAWSASRLEHPHSIRIIDFGQTPEGNHYIVMEFLKGRELAEVIRKDYPLPVSRIVHILCQVCSVLAEAHANKIIHRDLKPENIVLIERAEEKDFVKVLDFGIAKLQERDPSKPALTMQGIVCGTPEYMSPEQAMGKDLDARTDIYSVGCILYEMLTGKVPYDANTYQAILTLHIQGDLTPPSSLAPQNVVPGSVLEKICLKAMSKEREKRYESALEMKQALESALLDDDGQVVHSPLRTSGTNRQTPHGGGISYLETGSVSSQGRVSRGLGSGALIGVAALAVIVASGILYAIFSGGAEQQPESSEPDSAANQVQTAENTPANGDADNEQHASRLEPGNIPAISAPPSELKMSDASVKRSEDNIIKNGKQSPQRIDRYQKMTPQQRQRKSLHYYEKGKKAFAEENDREAALNFIRARDLNPASANAYKMLGATYMRMGRSEIAKENFLKYVELAPRAKDAEHYRKLASSL